MVAFLLAFGLGFISGCSKSNRPPAPVTAEAPVNPTVNLVENCDPRAISGFLAEIAKEEAAKIELDSIAKNAPEKSNFRKVYDAEIAFTAATEVKLAKMKKCGAPEKTLSGVKDLLAKAAANAIYLRESFPDFE